MANNDTIYSLSSGTGRAGVAVVRVSGPQAPVAVKSLCRRIPEPRRASLSRLTHPAWGVVIDEALVLWLPGPTTFTSEDMAEFHVHGGRAVIAALLDALGSLDGIRPAEAGEFTRRAFLNGRLDLVEVAPTESPTSKPSSSSSARRPVRNRSWSSTTKTRMRRFPASPSMTSSFSRYFPVRQS